ncbi:MAG: hypothetical protein MJ106_01605 [Lentisphaeria bacterium]|nr:hypothetical protein [Lentisphaeria bacterium]
MPRRTKISYCAAMLHAARRFKRLGLKGWPLVGMLFILLNVPLGWGGSIICIGIAHSTGKHWPYICATVIYILSWCMLFIGIALAGKEVYKRIKTIIPSAFKARKRLK